MSETSGNSGAPTADTSPESVTIEQLNAELKRLASMVNEFDSGLDSSTPTAADLVQNFDLSRPES